MSEASAGRAARNVSLWADPNDPEATGCAPKSVFAVGMLRSTLSSVSTPRMRCAWRVTKYGLTAFWSGSGFTMDFLEDLYGLQATKKDATGLRFTCPRPLGYSAAGVQNQNLP